VTNDALPSRKNSIDLLRLIAAFQVMLGHGMKYLPGAKIDWLSDAINVLPGVPLFFFLSGFLIAGSWSRKPDIASFAERRIRRIYPGLFATTALSIVAFSIFLRQEIAASPGEFVMWLVCQLTFLQSWNPNFIKPYGIGYSNVSLWTIPLELAFYVMTPIVLTIGKRTERVAQVIGLCTTVSFFLFVFFNLLYSPVTTSQILVQKVFLQSPLAAFSWFWMFGLGMLANHYKDTLIPLCVRNIGILVLLWAGSTAVSLVFELPPFLKASGNDLGLINFVLTSVLALAIAFRFPNLADRLLFGSDLSYGIYIYHIPVVNLILASGGSGITALLSLIWFSLGLAGLSWFFIESPSLGRQSRLLGATAPRA
jgi:peptidoglycan/LPS O-acetylase OafA/YrhL